MDMQPGHATACALLASAVILALAIEGPASTKPTESIALAFITIQKARRPE